MDRQGEVMASEELREYVVAVLDEYGEIEGRRILMRRLETDAVFRDSVIFYKLDVLGLASETGH